MCDFFSTVSLHNMACYTSHHDGRERYRLIQSRALSFQPRSSAVQALKLSERAALLGRQFELDLSNGRSRVKALRACTSAVKNGVAAVHAHLVLELLATLLLVRVSRICHPPVRLHERRRSKILILVPPVAWATRRAASAEDALVHAIKLLSFLRALQMLSLLWRVIVLQPRLNRLVLLVEEREVWYKVLDDVHVRKRIDLGVLRCVPVNTAKASQGVLSIDVHRT